MLRKVEINAPFAYTFFGRLRLSSKRTFIRNMGYLKTLLSRPMLVVALTVCAFPADAQLLKGRVEAKEMPDMLLNYTTDGDVMNLTSIELTADSTGYFAFNGPLPIERIEASLYVGSDIFGVYLERGKQVELTLKPTTTEGYYSATISGPNADLSNFYNTYVRAFDPMKYFSPDPSEAKSNDEYRQVLEAENAKVVKALPTIKNKQQRQYFSRLAEGMYKWSKIRIIMDKAYDEKKAYADYPEYNALIATIDPNDTLSINTNLAFAWLTAEMEKDTTGGDCGKYLRAMDVVDAKITNQKVRKSIERYLPYAYFSYCKMTNEEGQRFLERYKTFAPTHTDLVAQYTEKLQSQQNVKQGGAVPYDPTMQRPDGTNCKLADMKGKILYIDVWATWCGPCCREIPHLETLVEKMKENTDVRFISLSIDENREAWTNKLAKDNPAWEQFILSTDEQQKFMAAWSIAGIPRFIILDREGNIVNADAPRPSDPDLQTTLEQLAKQK